MSRLFRKILLVLFLVNFMACKFHIPKTISVQTKSDWNVHVIKVEENLKEVVENKIKSAGFFAKDTEIFDYLPEDETQDIQHFLVREVAGKIKIPELLINGMNAAKNTEVSFGSTAPIDTGIDAKDLVSGLNQYVSKGILQFTDFPCYVQVILPEIKTESGKNGSEDIELAGNIKLCRGVVPQTNPPQPALSSGTWGVMPKKSLLPYTLAKNSAGVVVDKLDSNIFYCSNDFIDFDSDSGQEIWICLEPKLKYNGTEDLVWKDGLEIQFVFFVDVPLKAKVKNEVSIDFVKIYQTQMGKNVTDDLFGRTESFDTTIGENARYLELLKNLAVSAKLENIFNTNNAHFFIGDASANPNVFDPAIEQPINNIVIKTDKDKLLKTYPYSFKDFTFKLDIDTGETIFIKRGAKLDALVDIKFNASGKIQVWPWK